jgi:uracil-DNA glycosylase family protein
MEGHGAAEFLPERITLPALRAAAAGCRGCELWRRGTQTVFGEGAAQARVMLVGEQPGDKEDLAGRPFVGPAGRLLDEALEEAGIDRDEAYVTNAVKHFKWEPRGPRRIHAKPNAREVAACRPWLDAELAAVQPEILVLLGATAAQALLGRSFRVTQSRGQLLETELGVPTLATIHPSAILRQREREDRARERDALVADLRVAASALAPAR